MSKSTISGQQESLLNSCRHPCVKLRDKSETQQQPTFRTNPRRHALRLEVGS